MLDTIEVGYCYILWERTSKDWSVWTHNDELVGYYKDYLEAKYAAHNTIPEDYS